MAGHWERHLDLSARTGVLLAGDLVAIGLFVLVGELRHGGTLAAGATTYAQFVAGWLVAAIVVGAYGTGAVASVGRAAGLGLLGWILGAVLGAIIRAALRPGFFIAPTFVGVTIGAGGVLLVAWRLLAAARLDGGDRSSAGRE
jgi:hypothetical protein